MSSTLRLTVKVLFGAAVVGALGLGTSQAMAAPAANNEPYYCAMECREACGEGTGWNGWRCIGNDCVCW